MDLLVLPGNSRENQTWIHKAEQTLAPFFGRTLIHEYAHWQTGESFIDFDEELAALEQKITTLGETYCIFAKSIGSVLALKGMAEGLLTPASFIVVGLPLGFIKKQTAPIGLWLRAAKAPLLFVQHTNDPVGAFADVKNFVEANASQAGSRTFCELPGDDHAYRELADIAQLVEKFAAAS